MITVSKAIEYLRSKKICKRWTDQQLREAIIKSVYSNALAYELDSEDNFVSFCFGEWKSDEEYHVTAIAANKGKIRNLLLYLKSNFPKCKHITGLRKEIRPRHFDIVKLSKKIEKYG